MMSNLSNDRGSRSRRGVALIVSISVLAILTIIVMGLAASQSVARHGRVRSGSERQARVLARMGLDALLASLPSQPTMEIEPQAEPFALREGTFNFAARPALPEDDTVYPGKFLKYRPGDAVATIAATSNAAAHSVRIEQTYLVNLDSVQGRRLLLTEKIDQANPVVAPAAGGQASAKGGDAGR